MSDAVHVIRALDLLLQVKLEQVAAAVAVVLCLDCSSSSKSMSHCCQTVV